MAPDVPTAIPHSHPAGPPKPTPGPRGTTQRARSPTPLPHHQNKAHTPIPSPRNHRKGYRPPPSNSTHTQKRSPRTSPPLPFFQPLTIINYNINGIKFVPHSNPSPYWLIIFMHHLTNIAFNGSIYR